jgi:hypothetical protein
LLFLSSLITRCAPARQCRVPGSDECPRLTPAQQQAVHKIGA